MNYDPESVKESIGSLIGIDSGRASRGDMPVLQPVLR
jgi:hypothetical protein